MLHLRITTTPTEDEWLQTYEVISPQHTQWALNSFDSFKSPGMDGIFPALLKWGGKHLTLKVTIVLRACLAHRYVPKQWREVLTLSSYRNQVKATTRTPNPSGPSA